MKTTEIQELVDGTPSCDRDELVGNIEISQGVYATRKFKLNKVLEGTQLTSLANKSESQTVGGTLADLCDVALIDGQIESEDIENIFDGTYVGG